MNESILLLLVLAYGLLLRLMFATGDTRDEWVSFWLINRQKGRRWLTCDVDDSVLEGIYGYPVLQHFLVSRFPARYWGLIGRVLNAAYDVCAAGFVYVTARSLFPASAPSVAGLSPALAASVLFLLSPILLPVTARMRTIKARSLGLLLITAYLWCLMAGETLDQPWLFPVAASIGVLVVVASMFAFQVLVFFSFLVSLLTASVLPAVVAVVAIVVAYFVPGLTGREALRFFWNHKVWYQRNFYKQTTAAHRNRVQDLVRLPLYLFTRFRWFAYLCFREITPIIAVYSAPIAFGLLALWLTDHSVWNAVDESRGLGFLWATVLASLIAFGLVSLRPLGFLGQAERYLEYSTPAAAVLCVALLLRTGSSTASVIFWSIVLFQSVTIFAQFLFMHATTLIRSEPRTDKALDAVLDWCATNLSDASMATVPCKVAVALSTQLKARQRSGLSFYYRFILRDGERGFAYYEEDGGGLINQHGTRREAYDVFKATPRELAIRHGITHLVVEKTYVGDLSAFSAHWTDAERQCVLDPLFENEAYLIAQVRA